MSDDKGTPSASRTQRFLLGDIDTRAVTKSAQNQVWKFDLPKDSAVVEVLYDLQLKAHSESLESYRAGLRSFDGLMIFAGAMVAWLAKFIADLPDGIGVSRVLAAISVVLAGISLCVCFLGRRSIARPAHIGLTSALKATSDANKTKALDWISRTMHVNRRKFAVVVGHIAKRYAVAALTLCLAVFFAVLAVCFQP